MLIKPYFKFYLPIEFRGGCLELMGSVALQS